ncbi:MAG: DNA starvation/stationary phase protection protein [Alphaproteobacteria bacterium]
MNDHVLDAKADIEHPDTGIENRKVMVNGLSGLLADTFVLLIKTQGYHWNVVGPLFVSIHELTERQYQNLFEAADEIAERIRALGYPAPGSMNAMIPLTGIQEDVGHPTAEQMIDNLVRDHEIVVQRLRATTEAADEMHDQVTADLLTERMAFHEQAIWMLRAIVS